MTRKETSIEKHYKKLLDLGQIQVNMGERMIAEAKEGLASIDNPKKRKEKFTPSPEALLKYNSRLT